MRSQNILVAGSLLLATIPLHAWAEDCFHWVHIDAPGPPLRSNGSLVFDAGRGVCVLFGGAQTTNEVFGDTWEWNGSAWSYRVNSGPPPRFNHRATYDSLRGEVLVFGGFRAGIPGGPNSMHGDLWAWNGWFWRSRTSNALRTDGGIWFDAGRDELFSYGGWNGSSYPATMLNWSPSAGWGEGSSISPGPRHSFGFTFDSVNGVAVLYGGSNGSGVRFGDTWFGSASGWGQVATVGPGTREQPQLVFDSRRGRILLFGGYGEPGVGALNDLWEIDVNERVWREISNEGAKPSGSFARVAYDSVRDVLVYFGNEGTWELRSLPPRLDTAPVGVTTYVGRSVSLTVSASCGLEIAYAWLRDGELLPNEAVETLTLESVTHADEGYYVARATNLGGTTDSEPVFVRVKCIGDVDGDDTVGLPDLAVLLRSFQLCAGNPNYAADADFDGTNCIDLTDLASLLAEFGSACPN